jgi:hypothetical protein
MNKIILPSIEPELICSVCGANEPRTVYCTDVYDTYTIENIPEYHCDICGEDYFHLQTMKMLDEVHLKYSKPEKPLRSASVKDD